MIVNIIIISIGFHFLISAYSKYRDLNTFSEILGSYQLPSVLNGPIFAALFVFFELMIGLLLLSMFEPLVLAGLSAVLVFLCLATVLVLFRRLKGERKLRCGCGNNLRKESNALLLAVRNMILIGLTVIGLGGFNANGLIWSKDVIFLYLAGFGILSILYLVEAIGLAVKNLNEWKTAG